MASPSILVVEDERVVAESLKETLRGFGYEVVGTAATGEEAVRMAGDRRPDLVLMDIVLEGAMDGIDAAETIRSRYRIPSVYLTAYGDEGLVKRAKLTEPLGYILKPFQDEELRANIEACMIRCQTEKRLAESEARYRAVVEAQTQMVCRYLPGGTITFVNEAFCRYFGKEPEELIGNPFTFMVPLEDRDSVEKHFLSFTPQNPVASHEHRVIMDDGAVRWQWWIDRAIFDSQGNIAEIQGVGHDITDRKRAEENLVREKDFSDAVVEGLPGLFYALDDHGKLLRWNNNVEKISGYSSQELSKMHPLDFFRGDDKETIAEGIQEVFAQGYAVRQGDLVSRDGSETPYLFTGRRVMLDGKPCLVGMGIDISEPKRVQEERDLLFSLSIDLLCVAGFDGFFKQLNPAWSETLGWTEEELLSKPWIEFVHPDDREPTESARMNLVAGRTVYSFENRYLCKDGTYRWLSWNSFPMSEGELIFAVARDVTERKELEKLLQDSQRMLSMRDRIAQIFLVTPDDQMYGEVLGVVQEFMESPYGIFGYVDEDGAVVSASMTATVWDECQMPGKTIVFPRKTWSGLWGKALTEKKTLYSNEPFRVPEGHVPIFNHFAMPIVHKTELVGILQLSNKEGGYDEEDKQLMESIGTYIAPLLHSRILKEREEKRRKAAEEEIRTINVQLERTVEKRTAELVESNEQLREEITERKLTEGRIQRQTALLAAINAVLIQSLTVDNEEEIAKACLVQAEKLTDSAFGAIGEVGEDDRLNPIAISDPGWALCTIPESEAPLLIKNMEIRGIWGSVLKKGLPQVFNDPSSHPDSVGVPQGHPPITSFLCVPLKRSGKTFGLIALANKERGYDQQDLEDVQALSVAFVEALERFRAERSLRHSEQMLAIRNRVAQVFLTTADDEVYGNVLDVILDALQSKHGIFGYIDEYGALVCPSLSTEIWDAYQVAGKDPIFPREKWGGIWGKALKEGRTYFSNEPLTVPEGHVPIKRAMAVPITHLYGVIGLFFVANKESDYLDDDRVLLEMISEYIAPTLYARLRWIREEKERRLAETALRESEEMRAQILETSPVGIAYFEDGKLSWANQAMLAMFGYGEEDDYHGREAREAYASDQEYRRVQRIMFQALAEGREAAADAHFRRKDGSTFVGHIRIGAPDPRDPRKASIATILDVSRQKQAEQALRKSEETLRAILATCPMGIGFTKNRKILWANEAWAEMFGFENVEEYAGKSVRMLYPTEEEYQRMGKELYDDLRNGRITEAETTFRRTDGSLFDAQVRMNALDPSDPIKGTIATITDISERKRAEQALLDTKRDLTKAQQISRTGSWSRCLETNEMQWSDQMYRIFGLPPRDPENVTFDTFLSRVHPDDREYTVSMLDAAKQARQPFQFEFRTIPIEGKEKIIREFGEVIADDTWQPVQMIGADQDITKTREAETKLRESEHRYRVLFEDSKDGVYVTTRDGRVVDVNPSFVQIFGYTREELLSMNIVGLYANPDDRAKFRKDIETQGFVRDYAIRFRRKDGAKRDCLLTASLRRAETGEVIGYQGSIRDVTDSKSLEGQLRQAQKMESLGTLAGGIAHDFNNILTIMSGYTELLLAQEKPGSERLPDLQTVYEVGQRGADLVRRILTFSRKLETEPRLMNLNDAIQQSEKLLRRTIPRMIDIVLRLADDLWQIEADPAQVDQALMNLAVNAAHAMAEGGKLTIETANITLDEAYCRTHVEARPGDYVLLSVSDTGHGIEEEVLEHIFEPFFSTKKPGEGTGLGLAMVYGIVKGHGGLIQCYSEPGAGTTFKLYFPVTETEIELDGGTTQELAVGGTETLLVVDDEEFVRSLGERILSGAGYTVLTADNGLEALKVFRENKGQISLVVLDLIMPEMGGMQCLKELLKLDPNARVVIASGFSASGPRNQAKEEGAKGFVGKPFGVRELLLTVRQALDRD